MFLCGDACLKKILPKVIIMLPDLYSTAECFLIFCHPDSNLPDGQSAPSQKYRYISSWVVDLAQKKMTAIRLTPPTRKKSKIWPQFSTLGRSIVKIEQKIGKKICGGPITVL